MTIKEIARRIEDIARSVHEDPYELFRRAGGRGGHLHLESEYAVDEVKQLISGCDETELCQIDRIVFGE